MNVMNKKLEVRFREAQKLHARGNVLGALRIYERILKEAQNLPAVWVYKALALLQLGRVKEAIEAAKYADKLLPEDASSALQNILGVVFRRLGMLEHAERRLRLAIVKDPDNPGIRNNLGLVLVHLGKYDEAEAAFEEALKHMKEDASAALNLARLALRREDFERAEEMLDEAKRRQPGHPDVFLVEAMLAHAEADYSKAFKALIQVLKRQPTHYEAWNLMASLDSEFIDIDAVEDVIGKLVRLRPNSARILALVTGFARKQLAWKHLEALETLLDSAFMKGIDTTVDLGSVFLLLSCNVSQKAHRIAAQNAWKRYIAPGTPKEKDTVRPVPRPLKERKIRIGYLSSDFRKHATGWLTIGVMEHHNHNRFKWFAYSASPCDNSEIRKRFHEAFDHFVNVYDLPDDLLAKRIREDKIDVLIDLNQMTAMTRVRFFCWKPAPVSIQWLGMPGTLGAGDLVDYVLLDAWTGYPGNLDGFDENPVILAGSYQPNDWKKPDLSLGKTRNDWGLPEKAPVFCNFNQTQKFSPDTVELWAEILRQVPDAVLWVMAPEPTIKERFLRIFTDYGIEKERIVFAEWAPHDVHIARLAHADLMLDNWPYNAHTTCSDALRAGTPVLTLPGATFASRVAAGVLQTSGLEDWIALSKEEYVGKAVAYGRKSWEERQEIKKEVFEIYWNSPMVDCRSFAKRLESFYEAAYERALAGKPPAPAWVSWDGEVHWELPPEDAWLETVFGSEKKDKRIKQIFISAPSKEVKKPEKEVSKEIPRRIQNLKRLAEDILRLPAPPLIVDIGAADIEGPVGFETLADYGLVKILGFESNPEMYQRLIKQGKPNRTYEPVAIGNGKNHVLHICKAPEMSSLLEPDEEYLSYFPMFAKWGEILSKKEIKTVRLDDLPSSAEVAMIKCDSQGSEFMILQNAEERLKRAVLLQLELSTIPLYKGEESLFSVGYWLEKKGWTLHTFSNINRRMLKPMGSDEMPYQGLRHIFQVDAVFIPDLRKWDKLTKVQLLELAFLADAIYMSYDLAMRALWVLDKQEGTQLASAYKQYLKEAGADA